MSTNNIDIDCDELPEVMNTVYVPYLKNKDRYFVCYGGAGSGKSHFIAQKWLFRIMLGMATGKRHKILALRKTQPAVRRSVFALFITYIRLWNLNSLCQINKQEMTITFTNGSEILCMGLDDPEKIKSIEGVTGVWIEEATEFTQEDFIQLNLRLRGETPFYKQIVISFNPISVTSWLKAYFFDPLNPVEKCTILKTTYKDNRFLDAEYIEVLEGLAAKDTTLHAIYALGEWGTLKGLIYTNWEITDDFPEFVRNYKYGVDFGFNHPSAILKIGEYEDYLFIDEILYERGLTNSELVEHAEKLIPDKTTEMLCDCAEPDRIKEFFLAGFNAQPCRKGKNSVKDGIDKVKSYKKLYITRRSVNTIKEIQTYKWKQDKDGNPLDAPVDFMDDAMAALRYGAGNADGGGIKIRELDF